MRTLIYKRTHTGDPDANGCFGIYDCMGRVRALSGRRLARRSSLIVLKSIEVNSSPSPGYGTPGTMRVEKPWRRARF
jgi:hypothetical protein